MEEDNFSNQTLPLVLQEASTVQTLSLSVSPQYSNLDSETRVVSRKRVRRYSDSPDALRLYFELEKERQTEFFSSLPGQQKERVLFQLQDFIASQKNLQKEQEKFNTRWEPLQAYLVSIDTVSKSLSTKLQQLELNVQVQIQGIQKLSTELQSIDQVQTQNIQEVKNFLTEKINNLTEKINNIQIVATQSFQNWSQLISSELETRFDTIQTNLNNWQQTILPQLQALFPTFDRLVKERQENQVQILSDLLTNYLTQTKMATPPNYEEVIRQISARLEALENRNRQTEIVRR